MRGGGIRMAKIWIYLVISVIHPQADSKIWGNMDRTGKNKAKIVQQKCNSHYGFPQDGIK